MASQKDYTITIRYTYASRTKNPVSPGNQSGSGSSGGGGEKFPSGGGGETIPNRIPNPIKPKEPETITEEKPTSNIIIKTKQVLTQRGTLSKIFPTAMASVVVGTVIAKAVDNVTSTALEFNQMATGNYLASRDYGNVKTAIGDILSPIETIKNALKYQIELSNKNLVNAYEREAIGYFGKGV